MSPPQPIRALLAALCALAVLALAHAASSRPATWLDEASGLAIGGIDPVAYFTDNDMVPGDDKYEYRWNGAVWRFRNPGNRAAFVRDPEVYAPRFAGYDVYAITEGRSTPGHPGIWAIHDGKIYLFFSAAHRRLWEEDRDGMIARAEKAWPVLARRLPQEPDDVELAAAPLTLNPDLYQELPGARPQAMNPGLSSSRDFLP